MSASGEAPSVLVRWDEAVVFDRADAVIRHEWVEGGARIWYRTPTKFEIHPSPPPSWSA